MHSTALIIHENWAAHMERQSGFDTVRSTCSPSGRWTRIAWGQVQLGIQWVTLGERGASPPIPLALGARQSTAHRPAEAGSAPETGSPIRRQVGVRACGNQRECNRSCVAGKEIAPSGEGRSHTASTARRLGETSVEAVTRPPVQPRRQERLSSTLQSDIFARAHRATPHNCSPSAVESGPYRKPRRGRKESCSQRPLPNAHGVSWQLTESSTPEAVPPGPSPSPGCP